MAAMTPMPDAGRVRRWLSRALVVSGGVVAATAIAWGASAESASAADNPIDHPIDNAFGDVSFGGSDDSAEHAKPQGGTAAGDESAGAPSKQASSDDDPSKWAGIKKAAERAFHHGQDTDGDCADETDGTDGTDGTDAADVDGQDVTAPEDALAEDGSAESEDCDADHAHSGDEAAGDGASDADAAATEHGSTGEKASGAAVSKLKDAHRGAKQAWKKHVADPTREALQDLNKVLQVLPGLGEHVDSPGFDMPWHATPDLDALPAPGEAPAGAEDDDHAGQRHGEHDADARAPGAHRDHATVSTSDDGDLRMSGAERAGHGDLGTTGADADQISDEPTHPVGPEKNTPAPAPMPTQSSHVTGAHADAPTGAVLAAADPFAASAVGAAVRPGHSLSSMSPGSQPGVTPD